MSFKMLTKIEKRGFESILKKLPLDELISLKDTVTKGRITTKQSYETIQAIISHSGTAKSLLTRKKIGRNYLFQYLTENEIVVPPQSEKELIIDKILEFWKSDLTTTMTQTKKRKLKSGEEKGVQNTTTKIKKTQTKKRKLKSGEEKGVQNTTTKIKKTQTKKRKLKSGEEKGVQNTTTKIKKTQTKKRKLKSGEEKGVQNTRTKIKKQHNSPKHTTTTTSSQSSALNFNLNVVQGNQSIIDGSTLTLPGPNIPVPVFQTNQSSHPINQPTGDKCMASSSSATDQEFAETFVKWFYKTINSQNPSSGETPKDFGPQHFWGDISLQLFTVNSNVKKMTQKFDGFEIVSQKLLAFAKEELYLFHPNISTEGVRSKKGPLDQLGISVCGMVHQGNVCLGVFEQDFGLALYPSFENNYKIKRIALKLRSSNVAAMPKLEEGKDLLAITLV